MEGFEMMKFDEFGKNYYKQYAQSESQQIINLLRMINSNLIEIKELLKKK